MYRALAVGGPLPRQSELQQDSQDVSKTAIVSARQSGCQQESWSVSKTFRVGGRTALSRSAARSPARATDGSCSKLPSSVSIASTHSPCQIKSSLSIALIYAKSRQVPPSASTNQVVKKTILETDGSCGKLSSSVSIASTHSPCHQSIW